MRKFLTIAGRLSEVHRFINVPMRWTEQYPARERREFWITQADGSEVKLVVHSRVMPARQGHLVNVLCWGDTVVGLTNRSTGDWVNFTRADPPLLLSRRDIGLLLCVLAAVTCGLTVLGDPAWLIIVLPAVASWLPGLATVRWIGIGWLQLRVQNWLNSSDHSQLMPLLRRVK